MNHREFILITGYCATVGGALLWNRCNSGVPWGRNEAEGWICASALFLIPIGVYVMCAVEEFNNRRTR